MLEAEIKNAQNAQRHAEYQRQQSHTIICKLWTLRIASIELSTQKQTQAS